jgi:cobalt-zinc-cadmium efflux system membrane fusion protein
VFVVIFLVIFNPFENSPRKDSFQEDHDGHEAHDGHNEHEKEHEVHDGHEEETPPLQLSQEEMEEFDIKLSIARKGKLYVQKNLLGEIVINEDRQAHIVPRVPGIVRDVKKTLGDYVEVGDVLAIIESRELADAKARYLSSLKRASLAQSLFNREKELWKKKISSEEEYLKARQSLEESQIIKEASKNKLWALGITEKQMNTIEAGKDRDLTRHEIVAPVRGRIIMKHITKGEKLYEDSNPYIIADMNSVWVNLTVYQKDLSTIRENQNVVVHSYKNESISKGVIDYVSPTVEETTRSATARVVIDNTNGQWHPGEFINVKVSVSQYAVDLVIPRSAIQLIEGKAVVFVQTHEGFEARHVETGRSDPSHIEILSGLKAGEKYVSENAFVLKAEMGKGSFSHGHSH